MHKARQDYEFVRIPNGHGRDLPDDPAAAAVSALERLQSLAAADATLEEAFNAHCRGRGIGLHMRHGRFYPDSIGQSRDAANAPPAESNRHARSGRGRPLLSAGNASTRSAS